MDIGGAIIPCPVRRSWSPRLGELESIRAELADRSFEKARVDAFLEAAVDLGRSTERIRFVASSLAALNVARDFGAGSWLVAELDLLLHPAFYWGRTWVGDHQREAPLIRAHLEERQVIYGVLHGWAFQEGRALLTLKPLRGLHSFGPPVKR